MSITGTDIKDAIIKYSRRSPINKYIDIIIEIGFLAPYFSSEPPKGLDPTFYHTLSYEGDMVKYERLVKLVYKA